MKQFNIINFLINHYSELDSTQNEAKKLIDAGKIIPNIAISADMQNEGRGRYDRSWNSGVGNLAISYCLQEKIQNPELICYVSVISLHEVLVELGIKDAKVKWVNDILISKKKISGILLESYKGFLICGVGCNIFDFDDMELLNATSLQNNGISITNIELIEKLTRKFSDNIKHFKNYGFTKFKNYWLEHAYRLGEEVVVNLSDGKLTGIFKTIDNEGKLVLEIDGNCHSISAGELFDI